MKPTLRRGKKNGSTLLITFGLMAIITIAATTYVDRSTSAIRLAHENLYATQTLQLCDSGAQNIVRNFWRPFKVAQSFTSMDLQLTGASESNPLQAFNGNVAGIGSFAGAVVQYYDPDGTGYSRILRIRVVGWIDRNGNLAVDAGEPQRTVDYTYRFDLLRSKVFDYTYFVNNFGWMEGFGQSDLIVNGDMRANGDFSILYGSGTFNGSLIACANNKLIPGATGVVTGTPAKDSQSNYASMLAGSPWKSRMRQSYSASNQGAVGSSSFEQWKSLIYASDAGMDAGTQYGATIEDSTGVYSWTSPNGSVSKTLLDTNPTQEVVMPDLNSFGNITDAADASGGQYAKSKAYTDDKATFADGTANPNYSGNSSSANELNSDGTPNVNYTGAYLDIWNASLNSGAGGYQRVSSQGVVSSSTLIVGTSAHPVRIHGPVAVNGDADMAGYFSGQGTVYASRNIDVLASVKYTNPPDFSGSSMTATDQSNEHKDFLGMAASQSVIMGDPNAIGGYNLQFMEPPFTHARYDDNGNLIPAYDASQIDSYGIPKYQSLLSMNATTKAAMQAAAAAGLDQIDGIMYTNFVGGGNCGTSGRGFVINGSIISRDEAMVTWSLPMIFNYDNRIKERSLTQKPLIDIDLPRSPSLSTGGYKDLGFVQN